MTEFFVKTDATVPGPFSGIELRELALAGILRPDSVISDSPTGPWHVAVTAGLFNEKHSPLPHPPGVQLTRYQVRGMPGAFQGPFKLRELIGFAARGMLPADALIQGEVDGEWLAAKRFRVLAACLDGDLVLLDQNRNVIHRAVQETIEPIRKEDTVAPIELTSRADERDSTVFATASAWKTDETTPLPSSASADDPTVEHSVEVKPGLRFQVGDLLPTWNMPEGFPRRIPLRSLTTLIVCVLVSVVSYTAYSNWSGQPMRRAQIAGDWLVGTDGDRTETELSAITFREDGGCVFFSPSSDSWSGDFRWVDRLEVTQGFHSQEPINVTIDVPEPTHFIDQIRSTDGYLKLSGLGNELPLLDGHPVGELFVRVAQDSLQIGYPTTIHWNAHRSQMMAAWVIATPLPQQNNVVGEISIETSPDQLIDQYGIPDEARRMYRFELRNRRAGLTGSHILRYDNQKMILTPQGDLEQFVVASAPNSP